MRIPRTASEGFISAFGKIRSKDRVHFDVDIAAFVEQLLTQAAFVLHSALAHDSAGGRIIDLVDGFYPIEMQRGEGILNHSPKGLCHDSLPPVSAGQGISDLRCGVV